MKTLSNVIGLKRIKVGIKEIIHYFRRLYGSSLDLQKERRTCTCNPIHPSIFQNFAQLPIQVILTELPVSTTGRPWWLKSCRFYPGWGEDLE